MTYEIRVGDVLNRLREMPDESVQCVVTSPPYWGLRDYGVEGQIGLEASPDEHVAKLVEVFREVRRVLRADGTLWLNYGDAYAGHPSGFAGTEHAFGGRSSHRGEHARGRRSTMADGLKPKDLIGLPWLLAFALRSDGWWLRSDIVWSKPNPMPESVRDRPTRAHEYVFLLTKAARYFYDAEAVREVGEGYGRSHTTPFHTSNDGGRGAFRGGSRHPTYAGGRNARSVWTINPQPFPEAHFATFPPALAERCIKAGSKPGDTVLDPFAGSGTTLLVAERLGRDSIGIELNEDYAEIARRRIARADPMVAREVAPGVTQGALWAK